MGARDDKLPVLCTLMMSCNCLRVDQQRININKIFSLIFFVHNINTGSNNCQKARKSTINCHKWKRKNCIFCEFWDLSCHVFYNYVNHLKFRMAIKTTILTELSPKLHSEKIHEVTIFYWNFLQVKSIFEVLNGCYFMRDNNLAQVT